VQWWWWWWCRDAEDRVWVNRLRRKERPPEETQRRGGQWIIMGVKFRACVAIVFIILLLGSMWIRKFSIFFSVLFFSRLGVIYFVHVQLIYRSDFIAHKLWGQVNRFSFLKCCFPFILTKLVITSICNYNCQHNFFLLILSYTCPSV